MGKRRIFEVFNIRTGMWESHLLDEDSFHDGMKKLNEESQALDAELKIISKINNKMGKLKKLINVK